MDQYYTNYKSATDFFTLEDFIFNCGAVLEQFYLEAYAIERATIRQDKQDEVVSFSHDWLIEKILDVKPVDGVLTAMMDFGILSFPYDAQNTGLQEVLPSGIGGIELERSNLTEIWQYKLLPRTNRIFWRVIRNRIEFFNHGVCRLSNVRVVYVPAISPEMEVPESLVEMAITKAVTRMKELGKDAVVKKSLDGNQNKTLATEIDTTALGKNG